MTEGKRCESALSFIGNDEVAVTAFTVHEVLAGLNSDSDWKKFLDNINVLDYDKSCAEISARLEIDMRKKGNMPGIIDMLIASVAIKNNLPLLTFDKSFGRIQGLNAKILS